MMHPEVRSVAAMGLALLAASAVAIPTREFDTLVLPLLGAAVLVFGGGLVLGSSRVLAAASVPFLGAAMANPIGNDEAQWVSSLLIGCLWYLAMEVGWEAVQYRDGTQSSRPVTMQRMLDVGTVVGVTLLMGLLGLVGSSAAPVRSFAVQAVIVVLVLSAAVAAITSIAQGQDSNRG